MSVKLFEFFRACVPGFLIIIPSSTLSYLIYYPILYYPYCIDQDRYLVLCLPISPSISYFIFS